MALYDSFAEQRRKAIAMQKENQINDINSRFNEYLNALQSQEQRSQEEATNRQSQINAGLQANLATTEQQRKMEQANIAQNRSDAEMANRVRARAVGGAPSSAYLQLAAQTDQLAGRQLAESGFRTGTAMDQYRQTAQSAVNDVLMNLGKTIDTIAANRLASQREKDAAIAAAELEAQNQIAELEAQLSSGSGYGSGGGEDPLAALLTAMLGGGQTANMGANVPANPQEAARAQFAASLQNSDKFGYTNPPAWAQFIPGTGLNITNPSAYRLLLKARQQ